MSAAGRGKRGELIHDISESRADLLYATGFLAPDAFTYFRVGAARCLVVGTLEHERAVNEAKKGIRVFNRKEFVPDHGQGSKTIDLLTAVGERFDIGHWLVPEYFPLGMGRELEGRGFRVECRGGEFFPERRRKTAGERAGILASLRVAETAMARAAAVIAEADIDTRQRLAWNGAPLTSEILRAEIEIAAVRGACHCARTIVAGGPQGAEPHNTGDGQLVAGKPIVVDIFPRSSTTGYWGDITRTFVKGRAPARLRRVYAAVREAREAAKDAIRPGTPASDFHKLAVEVLKKHGFSTGRGKNGAFGFIHGLGHGVGLDIHEAPRVSTANDQPLCEGDIVTVEPGLYYPGWGGVRLEDMVALTATGNECLTTAPDNLEID